MSRRRSTTRKSAAPEYQKDSTTVLRAGTVMEELLFTQRARLRIYGGGVRLAHAAAIQLNLRVHKHLNLFFASSIALPWVVCGLVPTRLIIFCKELLVRHCKIST